MDDKKLQEDLATASRELLLGGDFRRAEYLLWEIVRTAPRAPTATYLLGLAILYQRRWREARRLIDRAYDLRLWVEDRIAAPMSVELLREAAEALPKWDWPRYQLGRERWRSAGLTVVAATEHLAGRSEAPLRFVQIGANDGRSGDPLRALVERGALRGLMVEPQPEPYGQLVERYQGVAGLQFANVAVTEKDGPIEMTTASDRSTLGSILPDRNILSRRGAGSLTKITVEGLTFDSLLKRHDLPRFDLLQIDTEGFDYRVLKQVDLVARGVSIVNMEYYCLPVAERAAALAQLDAAGFAWTFGKMDVLAVKRDAFAEPFCLTDLTATA